MNDARCRIPLWGIIIHGSSATAGELGDGRRNSALPDRLCHRRSAGHGHRHRSGTAQRGHGRVVHRAGVRVRIRAHHARRDAGRSRLPRALKVAFAADTVSIAVMELLDNAFIIAVPGAMNAGLTSMLFWASLAASLLVAFVLTTPV